MNVFEFVKTKNTLPFTVKYQKIIISVFVPELDYPIYIFIEENRMMSSQVQTLSLYVTNLKYHRYFERYICRLC